jgi:hypothetical protein
VHCSEIWKGEKGDKGTKGTKKKTKMVRYEKIIRCEFQQTFYTKVHKMNI